MPEDPAPATPTGARAVKHVAASKTPSPEAAANALAFFMGDEPAPGYDDDDLVKLRIDFGKRGKPDMRQCVFRPLGNEEFVAAAKAALVKEPDDSERIDPFVNWSYVFAYACVTPDLTPALNARRERGDLDVTGEPFGDTAAIVRSVFRRRAGPLRAVMNKLEEASRMGDNDDELVQQVEAGKG